jgi:glycosyltransferase involved in cell wall biosynthesis
MAKRRIALIAPPWYALPPHGYGGTELVVSLLARGLRNAGHDVLLYGCEGSEEGTIEMAPPTWSRDLGTWRQGMRESAWASRVLRDLECRGGVDIIHDHAGGGSLVAAANTLAAPTVHTVHNPLRELWRSFYESVGDTAGLIAISHHQRRTAAHLNWAGTVHNAVDLDALHPPGVLERDDYLLCLSRVCPDKGQHIAVEVARRTGRRLILAGKIAHQDGGREYFDKDIRPYVDGDRVVYLENVGGTDKSDLIARAGAILAPLQWPEPFGLVMAEGLASGIPVIAMNKGAAPEIIHDGVTGFLVDTIDQMTDRVGRLHEIDPNMCGRIARECFSADAMAAGYASVYEAVIQGDLPEVPVTATAVGRDDTAVDAQAVTEAARELVVG